MISDTATFKVICIPSSGLSQTALRSLGADHEQIHKEFMCSRCNQRYTVHYKRSPLIAPADIEKIEVEALNAIASAHSKKHTEPIAIIILADPPEPARRPRLL
jgi:hypothetical protein